jgi:MFS family permease
MTVHAGLDNRSIFAACLISAAGGLVFNAFPLFLSSIARQYGLNDEELGLLGTYYLGAAALVSLLAPLWMPRLPWRGTAIAGYACIAVALMWMGHARADQIHWVMALLGAGCISIFTIALGILSAAADPNRAFGFKLTAEMVLAGILMFVMTGFVTERFGYQGFIWAVLITYGATALGLRWIPGNFLRGTRETVGGSTSSGVNFPAILACIALFVQFAALAGLWGFMERIGTESGIDSGTIGTVLTLSLLTGLCGALLAAGMGERFGHLGPILGAMCLVILASGILLLGSGPQAFGISACLINALVQFLVVFQMGLITEVDVSGRYTVIIAFVLCLGGAVGPGVMGAAIEARGFNSVYELAMIGAVIAMALTSAAIKLASARHA